VIGAVLIERVGMEKRRNEEDLDWVGQSVGVGEFEDIRFEVLVSIGVPKVFTVCLRENVSLRSC